MRRFVSVYSTIVFTVMITALLVGQVALAAPGARSNVQVAAAKATPSPTRTPTPGPKAGIVAIPKLNVRSSPSTSAAIVGKLDRGAQVQIVGSQPGWLQIVYSAGPGGRGWVSAAYVGDPLQRTAASGTKPATSKVAPAAGIPAPRIIAYRDPTFSWQWDGDKQMGSRDWYFDIQFYQGSAQDPYHVVVGEPKNARLVNGVWLFDQRVNNLNCDSYWVVQIAIRTDGHFAGWVSPKSNRLSIGGGCGPKPTDCPGCNAGS
jgi:uncharacterized protein YraI